MPNAFAYLVLFSWPLVGFALFRTLPTHKAIIWTILGGYLLLPEGTGIDLPLLPAFEKNFIPSATALLFCLPKLGSIWELLPRERLPKALAIIFLLSPVLTAFTNGDPQVFGPRVLPGLRPYDAFAFGLSNAVLLVPFLLSQRFIRTEAELRDLLQAVAVAGLAYSLPALFEVRMSPQLHTWIYGFFPHSFAQQFRFGGFRPVVFLGHSLRVGLFVAMALLATLAMAKGHRGSRRLMWSAGAVWLLATLALAKVVSAWAYIALLAPILLLGGRGLQKVALFGLGLMALLYPALRGADLIPTDRVMVVASAISEERAASLRVRLENEDILLARANDRPLFGWGGWGRSRVYDRETGEDLSVTDGAWIIIAGQYGWVGYIAGYGLLAGPLILMGLRSRTSFTASVLGLVLAANLLDLIPNSGLSPLTWLLAGGLIGALAYAGRRPSFATAKSRPADAIQHRRPTIA
ncbi:MAG: hypothetical protein AAF676_01545 [Pseudomonadota bacterium]